MHQKGHIGIGFLIYAPIAYHLVKFDWLMAFAFAFIAIGVWSFIPDIDMDLPLRHRGPTHSLVFAVLAGLLTAAGFGYLAYTAVLEIGGLGFYRQMGVAIGLGFSVGFLGVVGHIIGDVLTPTGVRPWWPGSSRRYSLNVVLAEDEAANEHLSKAGALAFAAALVLAKI